MGATQLWLCLYYPSLSLDMLCRGATGAHPIAITSTSSGRACIHSVNTAARRRNIRPGMSATEARALAADLYIQARNPARETNTLKRLADFCFQYTSHIVLAPADGLCLEIGGSLRVFKGLEALLGRIRKAMEGLGFTCQSGIAPSPCAAELFAHAAHSSPVTRPDALPAQLGAVPIQHLLLPADEVRTLTRFGFKKISHLFDLKEYDLRDRLKKESCAYLRSLYGKEIDPRPPYRPRERFSASIELPAMARQHSELLFACQRLLRELAGFLGARGCAVQGLEFTLQHTATDSSSLHLHCLEPSHSAAHWTRLLTETLSRQGLRAPVQAIELHTGELLEYRPAHGDLFASTTGDAQQLLEILTARLGEKAVQRIHARADHRPECAWSPHPGGEKIELPRGNRPLWLLPRPRPLEEAPRALHILAGPERIESGWWDGCDAKRDYYIARTGKGRRLWVYRELTKNRRWFIHGIFA